MCKYFLPPRFFEDINKMDLVVHVQWPLHWAYKNDYLTILNVEFIYVMPRA
jgi:hypothetical protein